MKFIAFLLCFFCQILQASFLIPERRKDGVSSLYGYLLVPVYARVPGIGQTFGAAFLDANVLHSNTDLLLVGVFGDVNAVFASASDIRLFSEHVVLGFSGYSTKIAFNVYDRTMNSLRDNYFSQVEKEYGVMGDLRIQFWEKRIQFFGHVDPSKKQDVSMTDTLGNSFQNSDNSTRDTVTTSVGATLDLTDHLTDPRRGVRASISRNQDADFDTLHSKFYTINTVANAYLPIGRSTLVFDYTRSSSFVTESNGLTQVQLQNLIGLNCGFSDPTVQNSCLVNQNRRIQERLANNKFGTALTLGGVSRLRSFTEDRFHGSQTQFFGAEFRLNLTDEGTPFNLLFMGGVRSCFQLAFFYEAGAVADPPDAVETVPMKSSYGAGFRMVFSGTVVRADVAGGDEGGQFIFFAGYPW